MGTATTLKQVYNFKGNFGAAVASIFNAAGLTAVFLERGMESLPPSRYEVSFDMGPPEDQMDFQGQMVYDYFQGCQLRIRLLSNRPDDQPSALPGVATMHDEFVATVYSILEERKRPFDPWLPYYQVNKILPRGTQSGLDLRWLEDWTTVTIEIWFGLRPGALIGPDGAALT